MQQSNVNMSTPRSPKTKEIIALKLDNPKLSQPEIAKIVGCDRTNVSKVLSRYNVGYDDVDTFKSHRADIFAAIQQRFLSSITDDDIKKAPLGSKVLAVAQLYDKERLERNLSTSNVNSINLQANIDNYQSEIDKIRARREALMGKK